MNRKRREESILHEFKAIFTAGMGVKCWILLSCFDMFGFSIIMTFMMFYAVKIKNATPLILGTMGVASTFSSILFMIPVGRAADRIGRKKVLYLGLIPFYAWILSLLFAPSPEWLVLTGIFQGFLWSTFPLWAMIPLELISEDQRGVYSGVKQMFNSIASIPAFPFLIGIIFESIALLLMVRTPETLVSKTRPHCIV